MGEARSSAPALDVGQTVVDQITHERVADRVEGLASLVPGPDELEAAEKRELVAERGHARAQYASKVPHAQLFVSQGMEHPNSGGIGQRLEHLDGVVDDAGQREPLQGDSNLLGLEGTGQC